MPRQIWTQEMREILYSRLLQDFGPYAEWDGTRRPHGKKTQFDRMLGDLAKKFSRMAGQTITARAVEHQIAWGLTTQSEMRDRSRARNYILNKAAALEVGFLASDDLPKHMSVRGG
jgi:hypothetical protein